MTTIRDIRFPGFQIVVLKNALDGFEFGWHHFFKHVIGAACDAHNNAAEICSWVLEARSDCEKIENAFCAIGFTN